jgi:hypothetical protein
VSRLLRRLRDIACFRLPMVSALALATACDDSTPVRWAQGVAGKPTRWRALPTVLYVERPSDGWGLDHRSLIEVVQAGLVEWGIARSIRVEKLSDSARESAEDGRSVVRLTLETQRHEEDVFGRTLLYTRATPGGDYAEIVEADIDIGGNAREVVRRHGVRLLRGIINHELGHFLGLDHPCARLRVMGEGVASQVCHNAHQTELMYPSLEGDLRSLAMAPSHRERAAISAAYDRTSSNAEHPNH